MQAFQILNDFNKSWNGGGQRYLVTNGMCAQSLSCVQLFVAPWTEAHQARLSMEFPRQEYRSGLLFPLQKIFLIQGSNPCLLHWQAHPPALAGGFFTTRATWEAPFSNVLHASSLILCVGVRRCSL